MKKRRLAAIMPVRCNPCEGGFTDIVGYTAMMDKDEDRAFKILRTNCEIHSILIEQLKGTLIKEMGDGMLISFKLAPSAMRFKGKFELKQNSSKSNGSTNCSK